MNVLIVGAGPTGLTAALELARQGVYPRVIDAKEQPSELSRAVGILPKSIEILERSGVAEAILKEGVEARRIELKRGESPFFTINLERFLADGGGLIGLSQYRTETLMSERLEELGVSVQYDTRVEAVRTTNEEVVVEFSGGRTQTYDWVIGADGIKSTVRESLGIPFSGYELPEDWSIADIEIEEKFDHTVFRAWMLEGDRSERDALVMVPIATDRVRLVSSTPDSLAALPLALKVREVRRSGTFKISVRQAERYVAGRVLLAGDAAHVHSPVGGRGMNLGIEDAAAAAQAILSGDIDTYERERKARATKVIRWTEFARKLLLSGNPLVGALIHVVGWLVRHSESLQRSFAKCITRA